MAIDPTVSDTARTQEVFDLPATSLANCVVVGGRRDGQERVAACVVLSTTRADVNGVVKRALDVRKASFLAQDDAVGRSGMEHGGITAFGLPDGWRVLVDEEVVAQPLLVMGSGVRASKLLLPGAPAGAGARRRGRRRPRPPGVTHVHGARSGRSGRMSACPATTCASPRS